MAGAPTFPAVLAPHAGLAAAPYSPHLAMVAGETSGDLLASLLLSGLQKRWPELKSEGIGGLRMQALGFKALWPSDKLAVLGYVDVLLHYREIAGIRRNLKERLLARRPDVQRAEANPFIRQQMEGKNVAFYGRVPAKAFVSSVPVAESYYRMVGPNGSELFPGVPCVDIAKVDLLR